MSAPATLLLPLPQEQAPYGGAATEGGAPFGEGEVEGFASALQGSLEGLEGQEGEAAPAEHELAESSSAELPALLGQPPRPTRTDALPPAPLGDVGSNAADTAAPTPLAAPAPDAYAASAPDSSVDEPLATTLASLPAAPPAHASDARAATQGSTPAPTGSVDAETTVPAATTPDPTSAGERAEPVAAGLATPRPQAEPRATPTRTARSLREIRNARAEAPAAADRNAPDTSRVPPSAGSRASAEAAHASPPQVPTSTDTPPGPQAAVTAPVPSPPAPTPVVAAPATAPSSDVPGNAAPVAPQDIPLQAEWLAQRGGGRARVALYPPHLGRVDLEVRMRGAEVDVVIAVQEISAESPMAAQRDSLSDALASRDLRLASFDVVSDEAELSQRESERRGQDADEQRGAAVSGRATLRGLDRPETSPAARGSDNAIDVRI